LVTAEEGQNYAVVRRINGSVLHVHADDGKDVVCHIPGRFRYKKHNNFISLNCGVLIERRPFETNDPHADLVKVYKEQEVQQIPLLYRLCNPDEDRSALLLSEGGFDDPIMEGGIDLAEI
jgi:translation initiation factor IF-1